MISYGKWLWHKMPLIFLVGSLSLTIFTNINLAQDIGRPFGGFLESYSVSSGYSIRRGTPLYWPPFRSEEGLRPGDRLKQINGYPYSSEIANEFFKFTSETFTLNVERKDNEGQKNSYDILLPVTTFTLGRFLEVQASGIILALGFWLLALAIYQSDHNNSFNKLVIVFSCVLMSLGLDQVSLFWYESLWDYWLDALVKIRGPFLAALTIHFALMFPVESHLIKRKWHYYVYVACYCLSLIRLSGHLLIPTKQYFDYISWSQTVGRFFYSLILVGLVILIGRIAFLHKKLASKKKREVEILLFGSLPALFFVIEQLPVWQNSSFFTETFDKRFLYLAIPFSITYIILRFRSFGNAPRKYLLWPAYICSSGFVASIVTSVYFDRLNVNVFQVSPLIPVYILIFLAALVVSIIGSRLSSNTFRFSPQKNSLYHLHVMQFASQIMNAESIYQLPQHLVSTFCQVVGSHRVALWLNSNKNDTFVLEAQSGVWLKSLPKIIRFEKDIEESVFLLNPQTSINNKWVKALPPQAEILLRLQLGKKNLGIMVIGARETGWNYHGNDLKVLELMGHYAALAILSALQLSRLERVPEQIIAAQDHERAILASELHDTILQYFGGLPFYLEMCQNVILTDKDEASRMLKHCIDKTKTTIQMNQNIQESLSSSYINDSLAAAITHFSKSLENRHKVKFHLMLDKDIQLETSTRHALFRVIEQAINNAIIHAFASVIEVSVWQKSNQCCFRIKDDGVGLSQKEILLLENSERFGLKGMKNRIEFVLNGHLEYKSTLGEGFEVSGWIII